MKKISIILYAITLFFFSCSNGGNDEKPKADSAAIRPSENTQATPPAMDPAAMQKAMTDFATPGDMHKWLAKFSGTWEASVIGFMDPAKPDTSKAINTVSMTLNGLFQLGRFNGKMMGRQFEGHSTMAYDNAKKLFISTWIDNLGSGIIYMTGTFDEKTKTLNLKGLQTDPMTGKDIDIREEMIMIDDDSYTLTMYGTGPDGKEARFMEGNFKRRK